MKPRINGCRRILKRSCLRFRLSLASNENGKENRERPFFFLNYEFLTNQKKKKGTPRMSHRPNSGHTDVVMMSLDEGVFPRVNDRHVVSVDL